VILAGGFGTRLRPLSCTRPKILFPIVNKPLLQWTYERLSKYGINEVIMAVNYQTEVAIRQHRIPKHGLHVTYSRDPPKKPLGSGGPIKKAERRIGHDEPFLALNGDIFADVDYRELLRVHEKKNAIATIALYEVEDPTRYGVAKLVKSNRIEKFVEKPSRRTAPSKLINAGAYILSPEIFRYIPKKRTVSIEREVFTKLAEEGLLYGYTFSGLWMDIGKPEDYLQINKTLLDSSMDQPKCKIGEKSVIKTPVAFDKGISIGEKSVVGPYVVLGRNVNIENNVHIEESMILSEVSISSSSTLKGAIVGDGVVIGKGVKIGKGCIIGDHARINNNVKLAEGVSICPAKEVSESVLTPKCIT
jgi:mannose-1-phosphate guanylyltransferase